MSHHILLREDPNRSLALTTETHALIFRHSVPTTGRDAQSNSQKSPVCIVEFSSIDSVDLTGYRAIRNSGVHGTLGLINVDADVFLCIISNAVRVATVRPTETVQRILSVEFYCISTDIYDYELQSQTEANSVDPFASESYDAVTPVADSRDPTFEHPCHELRKILSSGTFYYSVNFDLTNRLQDRLSEGSAFDIDSQNEDFLWNSYMIEPLIKFRSRLSPQERSLLDASRILTSAIRGFVLTVTIPASSSPIRSTQTGLPSTLTLLSRLSCRRAGTRFNSRGIDDDGYVSNFVETETVFGHPSGLYFSYAQVRGSVPIFWEQTAGLLPGQQKIQITRSPEATQPAFDKHFEHLELRYGTIHVLNLLSESKPGEAELTKRYKYHVLQSSLNHSIGLSKSPHNHALQESQFDFHAETKGPSGYEAASMVRHLIEGRADSFAYFLIDNVKTPGEKAGSETLAMQLGVRNIIQQDGVFRTNCLDCLDRTNLIQTIISQMALNFFLRHKNSTAPADFWIRHSSIWADNGDALSKIYAGTGALKTSFTRHGKMSIAGAIADARKSAARMYINNFADKGRQNTIDMLLGRLMGQFPVRLYDPVNEYISAELNKRINEYSSSEMVKIWVGTFNLNGRANGVKEDLSAWLCPGSIDLRDRPEIVAVGFQEIVELSPQQIMSTDPVRRQAWENSVLQTLNQNARRGSPDEYLLLRSGQLVGAALLIFVKGKVLASIKNVEGSVKKTGMSGMAGNKGAVAIRLDFANTRMCFVTAHLAAGFANYEERNQDYRTINHGLRFQRNRSIEDHDAIIWLGDFNYRIGLDNDRVRRLLHAGELSTLYHHDQLNLQMVAGRTFPFYSEARVTFMPTYKYNNGTDDYDTSEKARIPAWCDRVLRKGDILKQTSYMTAPLRFSDHRPVSATFQCTVDIVDERLKALLAREIYAMRKSDVEKATANAAAHTLGTQVVEDFEAIAPGLPAASSDRRKWWLDSNLPARSLVKPPTDNHVLNEKRPSNPFTPGGEADWVLVPSAGSSRGPGDHLTDGSDSTASDTTDRRQSSSRMSPNLPLGFPLRHGGSGAQSSAHEILSRDNNPAAIRTPSLSGSNVLRKSAPPIPKKPAILASTGERQAKAAVIDGASQGHKVPVPASASSRSLSSSQQRSSPADTMSFTPSGDNSTNQSLPSSHRPALPLRRHDVQASRSVDLLGEDADQASTIPALRPSR